MAKDRNKDASFDDRKDTPEDNDWDINIDQLLEQADMLVNNDMLPPMPGFEEESSIKEKGIGTGAGIEANGPERKPEVNAAKPEDSAEVPKAVSGAEEAGRKNQAGPGTNAVPDRNADMDSDMDEINSLLEQANLNEQVDEDMLALLENANENQQDDNPDEVFDIFSEGDMPLGDLKSSGVPEQEQEQKQEEKETGKKKKRGWRKKKQPSEKKEKKLSKKKKKEPSEEEEKEPSEKKLKNPFKKKKENDSASESESGEKEKKPGFLAKVTALFGGGEDFDDGEPDTAKDNKTKKSNELNEDGEKKPVKKGKKKKEKDQEPKNGKAANPKDKRKAKVKLKEKKPKAKKEKAIGNPAEKPVRILNGRSFAAIVGLCFSIIAGVMIAATFLPEYADKQAAREAFLDGDYETVYKLFYDKRLSEEEKLLFHQSKVIRQMERRLESYQNNITLGRELEAVDALMRGVESYQNLWEADEYQVRSEVDALYGQICGILESNYGVSQEEAVAIASYDKIEYTKALYMLLGESGISFAEEGASGEEAGGLSDGGSVGGNAVSEPGDAQQPDGALSEDTPSENSSSEEMLPEDMLPAEEDILN